MNTDLTRESRQRPAVAITRRRVLSAVGWLGLLCGCGVIPNVDKPLTLYSLSPKMTGIAVAQGPGWQLVVAEPRSGADLATNRIALTRAANRIEYFAEGVWSDAAPALVQSTLIEAFEDSAPGIAIGRDSAGLKPDYILQSELREFTAVYAGSGGEAAIRIAAKLVKMPERRIVASFSVAARRPSVGAGLPGIIAAFEAALGDVYGELIAGVLGAAGS
jgi:cholesterol transport system auxiliary component